MRPVTALLFLVSFSPLRAQSPGDLQLVLDPPGDMQYATFIDGALTDNGDLYFLGGYQNVGESAFTLAKFTATGVPIWGRKVETTAADLNMSARKVMVDASGNITVFGYLSTVFGTQYFLIRMTPEGTLLSQRSYMPDGSLPDYGYSSAQILEDGGVMMSIGLETKALMARIDVSGQVVWCRHYITTDDPTFKNPGFDPAITPDGGALITAKAESDMFLVRIDANGSVQWSNRYNTSFYTHTKTAVSLADGGFLVAGVSDALPFAARLDASGNILWNRKYVLDEGWIEYFRDIQPLPDGGFLLSPSGNSMSVMGVRITSAGDPVEVALIDGQGAADAIGTQGDKVLMIGRTTTEVNGGYQDLFLLLKLNADLGMSCLRAASGAWTMDQPLTEPPVPGCTSDVEPLTEGDFFVVMSDVAFNTRDLCASLTGVGEQGFGQEPRVFPSPVNAGIPITVDLHAARDVSRVDLFAPDGRSVRTVPVSRGVPRIVLETQGLAPGLYLIRTTNVAGVPVASARVVVE